LGARNPKPEIKNLVEYEQQLATCTQYLVPRTFYPPNPPTGGEGGQHLYQPYPLAEMAGSTPHQLPHLHFVNLITLPNFRGNQSQQITHRSKK
jgi:hypothetical protein